MLSIKCFVNELFTSNTYLLSQEEISDDVYLVDIGNAQDVLSVIKPNHKLKGIFLTHAHYDHIYGINEILKHFPDCIVYCSEYAELGLYSEKLNLSYYHLEPIVFKGNKTSLVIDGMVIEIYPNCKVSVFETPGHNQGSVSFVINEGVFTGDSLIPGFQVVTKLKSGDKASAIESIHKIRLMLQPNQYIYPGHGAVCNSSEVDWNFYKLDDRN